MSNMSIKLLIHVCLIFCALLFFVILASAKTDNAAVSATHNDDGNLKPYKMTSIKSLTIKENGAWSKNGYSQDESPDTCKVFQMKEKDVRDYFIRAKQISDEQYDDPTSFYESRCYAAGKIEFANGDQGTWRIDFERRGLIVLSDNREFYFFCSKCRGKVFYPWAVK